MTGRDVPGNKPRARDPELLDRGRSRPSVASCRGDSPTVPGRRMARAEQGSITVLGAGIVAVVVVSMMWIATLTRVSATKARTQTAADIAALAAAGVVADESNCASAQAAARTVLTEYDATLEQFECGQFGTRVIISTQLRIGGIARTLRARAQAELSRDGAGNGLASNGLAGNGLAGNGPAGTESIPMAPS